MAAIMYYPPIRLSGLSTVNTVEGIDPKYASKLLATFPRVASRTPGTMRPHARVAQIKTQARAILVVCAPSVPTSFQPWKSAVLALWSDTLCLRRHIYLPSLFLIGLRAPENQLRSPTPALLDIQQLCFCASLLRL
ncbi:hypothetical protein BD311DRAFT_608971, partial [Dichomitus squalens]